MATAKAIAFAGRARAMATTLEIAYRQAKRLSEFWAAAGMNADIPAGDQTVIEDGNAAQPITYADVRKILDRANELILDQEGTSAAKLAAIIRVSDAPGDWR